MTELAPMVSAEARSIAQRVQGAFERVRNERMAGLPFLNERLAVELVGLRRWRGRWLGVLVTPWFMNLMLLPGDGQAEAGEPVLRWPRLALGDAVALTFPAGVLEFVAGREGSAGEYLACSLFSPMFEFADHDAARQIAAGCLAALLDAGTSAPVAAVSKRDFLRGRWSPTTAPAAADRA